VLAMRQPAYVLNNPASMIDPLGLDPAACQDPMYATSHAECSGDSICEYFFMQCGGFPPGPAAGGGGGGGGDGQRGGGGGTGGVWGQNPPNPDDCNDDPSGCYSPPSPFQWWWPIPPGLGVITLDVIFHAQGSAKGPKIPTVQSPIYGGLLIGPNEFPSLYTPDVPASSAFCSAYRDGTGAGAILYQICMNSPSGNIGIGRWGNCVRGNLLREFIPNDNPVDLIFRYGVADHFYYFTACAVE